MEVQSARKPLDSWLKAAAMFQQDLEMNHFSQFGVAFHCDLACTWVERIESFISRQTDEELKQWMQTGDYKNCRTKLISSVKNNFVNWKCLGYDDRYNRTILDKL